MHKLFNLYEHPKDDLNTTGHFLCAAMNNVKCSEAIYISSCIVRAAISGSFHRISGNWLPNTNPQVSFAWGSEGWLFSKNHKDRHLCFPMRPEGTGERPTETGHITVITPKDDRASSGSESGCLSSRTENLRISTSCTVWMCVKHAVRVRTCLNAPFHMKPCSCSG